METLFHTRMCQSSLLFAALMAAALGSAADSSPQGTTGQQITAQQAVAVSSRADGTAKAGARPAQTDSAPSRLREAIGGRVDGRWASLIASDFERAYAFELPSYRALFPFADFRLQFGRDVDWLSAEVVRVELTSDDRADVVIDLTQSVAMVPGEEQISVATLSEVWLLRDGEWWHVAPLSIDPAEESRESDADTP